MKNLPAVKIPEIPAVVFSPDTVELGKLLDEYSIEKIPTDLTVKENYDFVVEGKKAHLKCRQKITDDHKDLKYPFREAGLQLDCAKNSMLEVAKPVEYAYSKAKKDFDDIEKKRLEAIAKAEQEAKDEIIQKISWIGQYSSRLIQKPASDVEDAIADLKGETFEWCGDFIDSAKNTVSSAITQLEAMLEMKLMAEKTAKLEAENSKLKEREVVDIQVDGAVIPEVATDKRTETIKALTVILSSDDPADVIASILLAAIENGKIKNLYFDNS